MPSLIICEDHLIMHCEHPQKNAICEHKHTLKQTCVWPDNWCMKKVCAISLSLRMSLGIHRKKDTIILAIDVLIQGRTSCSGRGGHGRCTFLLLIKYSLPLLAAWAWLRVKTIVLSVIRPQSSPTTRIQVPQKRIRSVKRSF